VLHPFINGTGVRQGCYTVTNTDYKSLYQANRKIFWRLPRKQSSSVIGTIVPYVVLGKIAHGELKGVAEQFELKSATSTVLRNEAVANVAAAGAYEFLKKPTDGQTRIGNSLGTMASFTAYEGGSVALNKLTPFVENKLLKVAVMGTGRALIGATGGEVAYESSNVIAAHTGGKILLQIPDVSKHMANRSGSERSDYLWCRRVLEHFSVAGQLLEQLRRSKVREPELQNPKL